MNDFEQEPQSDSNREIIPGIICEIIDDGEAVQVDVEDYRLIFYKNEAGEVLLRSEANMVKQTGSYEIPELVMKNATEAAADVFARGSNSPYLETNENSVSPEEARANMAEIKDML